MKGWQKGIIPAVMAGVLLLSVSRLEAAFDPRYDSKEDLKGQYEATVSQKLSRGAINALFGWTEIARTPIKMSAGIEHNALTSFIVGVPYGVFRAAGRTLVGVYEVGTCYAPQSPVMTDLQGDIS